MKSEKQASPFDVKERLREAIQQSGKSLQELGRQSGVGPDRLSRFVRGQRGLSVEAVSKLCYVLGLQLMAVTKEK